jgi:hypothetical protein
MTSVPINNIQSREIVSIGLLFGFLILIVRPMLLGMSLNIGHAAVETILVIAWLGATQYMAGTMAYDPIEQHRFPY